METVFITGAGSEMQGVGRLSDGRAVFVPVFMYCTLKHLREFVITTPKQTVPVSFW